MLACVAVGLLLALTPSCLAAPDQAGDPPAGPPATATGHRGGRTDGFPDERTTGVPQGTKLTRVHGQLLVTEPGAVLDALDLDGCIEVRADDVTVRRSRIRCRGQFPIRLYADRHGLLVEDVEIDGTDVGDSVAIGFGNYTLRRANVHHVQDGPRVGSNTIIEDSYIHQLTRCGDGCHNDGIQASGGSDIVIRRNNIQNPRHQTSAILLGNEFSPLDHALIENNLLNGGNYTIFAGRGTVGPNVVVRGNRFGRDRVYGLLRPHPDARVEWTGNVWDDTGETAGPWEEADPGVTPEQTRSSTPTDQPN